MRSYSQIQRVIRRLTSAYSYPPVMVLRITPQLHELCDLPVNTASRLAREVRELPLSYVPALLIPDPVPVADEAHLDEARQPLKHFSENPVGTPALSHATQTI
jgi:hypothetical protein